MGMLGLSAERPPDVDTVGVTKSVRLWCFKKTIVLESQVILTPNRDYFNIRCRRGV
jgi:hypothetical protein